MKLTQNLHINCIDLNERGLVFQRLIDMGFENRGVDFYFKNVNVNHTKNFFMTATGGDIWRASEVLTGKKFISKYGKSEMKQSIEKAMADLKMGREELSSALGMSRPYITKMLTCPQSEKTQEKVVKMIDELIKNKNMKSMSCLELTGVSVDCEKIQEQQKTIKELSQALEYKDQLLARNADDLHKQTNRVNAYKDDNSKLSLKIYTQQKSIEDKASELLDFKNQNRSLQAELKALKRENKDLQIHHAIVCVILIILVVWEFYV